MPKQPLSTLPKQHPLPWPDFEGRGEGGEGQPKRIINEKAKTTTTTIIIILRISQLTLQQQVTQEEWFTFDRSSEG